MTIPEGCKRQCMKQQPRSAFLQRRIQALRQAAGERFDSLKLDPLSRKDISRMVREVIDGDTNREWISAGDAGGMSRAR